MSLPRILGIVLGLAIIAYGAYEMAVVGNMIAFIFVTGGIVIVALASGVLGGKQAGGEGEE